MATSGGRYIIFEIKIVFVWLKKLFNEETVLAGFFVCFLVLKIYFGNNLKCEISIKHIYCYGSHNIHIYAYCTCFGVFF